MHQNIQNYFLFEMVHTGFPNNVFSKLVVVVEELVVEVTFLLKNYSE